MYTNIGDVYDTGCLVFRKAEDKNNMVTFSACFQVPPRSTAIDVVS